MSALTCKKFINLKEENCSMHSMHLWRNFSSENYTNFYFSKKILQLNEYHHNKFIAFLFMKLFSFHSFISDFFCWKVIVQVFIHEFIGERREWVWNRGWKYYVKFQCNEEVGNSLGVRGNFWNCNENLLLSNCYQQQWEKRRIVYTGKKEKSFCIENWISNAIHTSITYIMLCMRGDLCGIFNDTVIHKHSSQY
jgi:hypothetical protein